MNAKLSVICSAVLHVAAIAAVHTVFDSATPERWLGNAGVNSVRSAVAIEISAEVAPQLPHEVSIVTTRGGSDASSNTDSNSNAGVELVAPASALPQSVSQTEATFPTADWNVLHQPPELARVESGGRGQVSDPNSTQPVHDTHLAKAVRAAPPSVSSVAALESEFSSGSLEKSVPQPIYNPTPPYPPQLLAAKQSGLVSLLVQVNPDGGVANCRVHTSSGFKAFDDAAVATVRQWRFRPAMRFGIPVATTVLCPIRFQFFDR